MQNPPNPRPLLAGALALGLLLSSAAPAAPAADDACTEAISALETALVRLAADRIDDALGAVADSTRALGDTYAQLAEAEPTRPAPDRDRWLERRATRGGTTGFRTWPDALTSPPAFQAPYPGFYSYAGADVDEALLRELALFERLLPAFRSAYRSFPFSWVYVTTADQALMIYPYVPIEQAANNGNPTRTPYYNAADFERRAVGWTAPYLDLVGAGMMVTASYPIYQGDTLLGVMSRDITLKELTDSVLRPETGWGASVLLVDRDGLAIGASDPDLAAELDAVNTKSGAAVLYYRSAEGMQSVTTDGAVASADTAVDALVERLLAAIGDRDSVALDLDGQTVLAARVPRTGWLLILSRPPASLP